MEGGGDEGLEMVLDSKDMQQQNKALDKLTDRVEDRQLDSTRVQEAMASISASKQADIQAARFRSIESYLVMDSGAGADDELLISSTTDAELLKRAWRNEKAAPEILKFDAHLLLRSQQQIQLMEEMVEDFNKNGVDPLTLSLYQMDLDRTIFLLRSYLRTRLHKIEKYVFHIEKTVELWNRLSKQEQKFAKRCAGDLKNHLEQSVLSKLPDQYQSHLKQSAASEDDDMVPEPQLDSYVVCRSKRFLGAFQLDDGGEEPVTIEADDLYALPYKSIKPLVETGQIDLV